MSLYDDLQVAPTATAKEIKAAHRRLAKEHHPDKGGEHNNFVRVQKAYEVLSDPFRRKHYDQFGADRQTEDIRAQALQGLAQLFIQVLDQVPETQDLIKVVSDAIQGNLMQMKRDRTFMQVKRRKLTQVRKRLDTDGDRVLLEVLASKRKELWAGYKIARSRILMFNVMAGVVGDYHYRADPAPPPRQWRHSSYVRSTTA